MSFTNAQASTCMHTRTFDTDKLLITLKGGFHRNHGKHATDGAGAMPNKTITTKLHLAASLDDYRIPSFAVEVI